MPIFLELRIEFIDPCFATFYHCQLKVYEALYRELRNLADANFDMTCSAMNGFVAKWDVAQSLFDELTIPKRRGKEAQLPAQPALSQSGSNADLPAYGADDRAPSNYPKSGKSAGAPLATMAAVGAALPKNAQSKKYVIALYDFDAQADGDLSFRRDDKIEVLEKTENQNDWWTGTINGTTGQFPGNYVAEI
jgi:amphiphysin